MALLDQLLSVVLKQFIEENGGRIPAAFGLAARISTLAFRKFRHLSKPDFALNFSGANYIARRSPKNNSGQQNSLDCLPGCAGISAAGRNA
jgi:hypothetical protein